MAAFNVASGGRQKPPYDVRERSDWGGKPAVSNALLGGSKGVYERIDGWRISVIPSIRQCGSDVPVPLSPVSRFPLLKSREVRMQNSKPHQIAPAAVRTSQKGSSWGIAALSLVSRPVRKETAWGDLARRPFRNGFFRRNLQISLYEPTMACDPDFLIPTRRKDFHLSPPDQPYRWPLTRLLQSSRRQP